MKFVTIIQSYDFPIQVQGPGEVDLPSEAEYAIDI